MATISIGRALPRPYELVRSVVRPAQRVFPGQLLAAVVREYRQEYQVQCDIERVTALDDRLLRDIGLSRGEIEHVVRDGRQADTAPQDDLLAALGRKR